MEQFQAHAAQMLYPPEDQRNGVEAWDWTLTESYVHTLLLQGHTLTFDCSDSSSWIFKACGLWPVSRGPGYTGTWIALGLPEYQDGKNALRAAPVIFGPGTGHHMGLVHTPDPKNGNPLISEHGTGGWAFTRLAKIIERQTGEGYPGHRFLDISRL
jgi:hypothetical protein